jgi:hypothetical protein
VAADEVAAPPGDGLAQGCADHRLGQQREVRIYSLATRGTVDEMLLRVLGDKIRLFELVVGEVEMILRYLPEGDDFSGRVLDTWVAARDEAEARSRFDRLGDELLEAKERYLKVRRFDEEIFEDDLGA